MIVYSMFLYHSCLFLIGLIKKNSHILLLLQMLWMYFLAAGDTGSADFGVNLGIYEAAEASGGLYSLLCWIGNSLGLDVVSFNAILLVPMYLILWKVITSFTTNISFVGSLILLYPFFDMVTQKRWFFASIICIIGLMFLLKKCRMSKIIFIVCVAMASSIHAASLGYLIFILSEWFSKISKKKIMLSVFFMISVMFSYFAPDILGLVPIIGEDRANLYFKILHEKMNYPLLTFLIWMSIHMFFVWMSYRITEKYPNKNKFLDYDIFHAMNCLSLLMIPLYYWEPTFWRVYRNILIIDYIYIASSLPTGNVYKVVLFKKILLFIIFFIMVAIFSGAIASAGFDNIILPIFDDNIIYKRL